MQQAGKKISQLNVGDRVTEILIVTQEQIDLFARATGDHNPIHIDPAYATTTQFKNRIAHGVLLNGIVSGLLGMRLPGLGTIARELNSKFLKPVFPDDEITVEIEVIEVIEKLNLCTLKFEIRNQENQIVCKGQAKVIPPQ